MNWLKKLWNWLKIFFINCSRTTKPVEPPSKRRLSDAEYENILFALLAAIKRGRSWGNCQGFLISRNVKPEQLAEWIEEKSLEWLDNRDNYQELGRDLEELGNIASGKLRDMAIKTSRGLNEAIISIDEQLTSILGYREYDTYLAWTNEVREEKIEQLQTLINQPQQSNENKSELYREMGGIYAASDDLDKELECLETAIQFNSNNAKAWNNRGVILENLGRFDQAIASYDKALEIKPNFHQAWYNRGDALFNLGRFDEAIASYDKALEIKPDFDEAWYNRGDALFKLRRFDQAIASYDKALEIKPDFHQAWYNRGVALYHLEKFDEAIASYDKALEIKPDFHQAWDNRGVALDNLGSFDEAIASYDKALEIKPDFHQAWDNRGDALKNLRRFTQAITSYDKALEIKPDFHQAWNNRGDALDNLGSFDEAIADYDKALKIKPNFHDAWYNRGNALDNLGRFDEAIASYDKALEIKPDDHEAWYNRGDALKNLGRFDEAIASYDKALEIKPDDHEAWYNRGVALDNLGSFDEAIASYDKALELKLDFHQAWNGRGLAAISSSSSEGEILRKQSQFIERFRWELTDASRQLINYFQSLETGDFRHLISVLQQPNSDKLIQFIDQSQSESISQLNPQLNKRGYKGQLISYRYPLNKHIYQDSHPEGWGFLHHKIGVAQYEHQEYHNAINNYHCALETLNVKQFTELRLEVIQDLVKAYLAVGDKNNADDYLLQGLKLLNQLLDKVPIAERNQRLRLEARFLIFRQLKVNFLLEKGEIIEALLNAELEKNRRLIHILEGYKTESQLQGNSNIYPSYEQIQRLLNEFKINDLESRNKAIVYWFNSPMGLITFIIKQGLKEPIYKTNYIASQDNALIGDSSIEQWIKAWDKDYQDYRYKKDTETHSKTNHSWRINFIYRLKKIKEILGIDEIEKDLQDIEELILIPHQDLHRFPLHYLFKKKKWTISYLPSLQIGLKLKQQSNNNDRESLLSIENPRKDLIFSEIESVIVNTYFATIEASITTIEDFKNAIPNHTHLHFTGHGYYNFDDPKRSFLEFENKSQLTAEEISKLNFNSYELITLAACETALNGQKTIESEYVGLVSAFLKSGANCVISTLWTVDETSSAWLMIYFYQQYRAGITAKIALKNAQQWLKIVTHKELIIWLNKLLEDQKNQIIDANIIALIKDESNQHQQNDPNIQPYEHPYYWLGFIVNQV